MAGLFGLLGLARLARKLQGDLTIVSTLICALAAAALTGLAEASWYAIKTGAPFDLVLGANLDFSLGLRPAWYALAGGLVLVLARLSRPLFAGGAARGRSAAKATGAQAPARQRNSA